jgi:hypothetical protein
MPRQDQYAGRSGARRDPRFSREALASVASVARLTLTSASAAPAMPGSCAANPAPNRNRCPDGRHGGRDAGPVLQHAGRRKFLKSESTEFAHCAGRRAPPGPDPAGRGRSASPTMGAACSSSPRPMPAGALRHSFGEDVHRRSPPDRGRLRPAVTVRFRHRSDARHRRQGWAGMSSSTAVSCATR